MKAHKAAIREVRQLAVGNGYSVVPDTQQSDRFVLTNGNQEISVQLGRETMPGIAEVVAVQSLNLAEQDATLMGVQEVIRRQGFVVNYVDVSKNRMYDSLR